MCVCVCACTHKPVDVLFILFSLQKIRSVVSELSSCFKVQEGGGQGCCGLRVKVI